MKWRIYFLFSDTSRRKNFSVLHVLLYRRNGKVAGRKRRGEARRERKNFFICRQLICRNFLGNFSFACLLPFWIESFLFFLSLFSSLPSFFSLYSPFLFPFRPLYPQPTCIFHFSRLLFFILFILSLEILSLTLEIIKFAYFYSFLLLLFYFQILFSSFLILLPKALEFIASKSTSFSIFFSHNFFFFLSLIILLPGNFDLKL